MLHIPFKKLKMTFELKKSYYAKNYTILLLKNAMIFIFQKNISLHFKMSVWSQTLCIYMCIQCLQNIWETINSSEKYVRSKVVRLKNCP